MEKKKINKCVDCGSEKIFCKKRCRRCYNKIYNNSLNGKAVQKKYNDKRNEWRKNRITEEYETFQYPIVN